MATRTSSTLISDVLDACTDRTPYSRSDLTIPASRFITWGLRIAALDPEPSTLFTRRNIERFIQQGLDDYAPATRGNIRSKLLRMSELVGGPHQNPTRLRALPPANALRPYTARDIAEMRAWARTQRDMGRRRSATVLLALGLGAGLPAAELAAIRVRDIDPAADTVIVHVGGARPRAVPVTAAWADELRWAVGGLDPDAFAFRPGRQSSWPNVISNFVRDTDPKPQSQRMRSTWIVTHLAAGTNVRVLVDAAAVDSLEAFTRYLAFVPLPAPAVALAQLVAAGAAAPAPAPAPAASAEVAA